MITTNTNRTTHNTITGFARETHFKRYEDEFNRVMSADSYKYSQAIQYPEKSEIMFDYAEARDGREFDVTLFNGLQPKLKKFFSKPIQQWEVDEAFMYSQAHGVYFDVEGWDHIAQTLKGNLPVSIKAVPEGTVIPVKNVLFTIESTDEKVFWASSWLETILMTTYYTCNVATITYHVRLMLEEYANITMDNPDVSYMFHNFGARGAANPEAAVDGGMAHLITGMMGSDNFNAMRAAHRFYNVKDITTIMHSINATEHSSTTSWGRDSELEMIMNHLEVNKGQIIIAAVMDSFNYFKTVRAVCEEGSEFQKKINSDEYPILVLRPDSGIPEDIVNATLDIMEDENVPFVRNNKGFKIFKKMRLIWGDGINMVAMRIMLKVLISRGYSIENIAFGSGGWIMQQHDRDTQGWAIKCSSITVDGEQRDVFKDPITAPNKKSKKGALTLYFNKETKTYFTDKVDMDFETSYEVLETVFKNGKMVKEWTLAEARANNATVKVAV